jgi:hypothetical protein
MNAEKIKDEKHRERITLHAALNNSEKRKNRR